MLDSNAVDTLYASVMVAIKMLKTAQIKRMVKLHKYLMSRSNEIQIQVFKTLMNCQAERGVEQGGGDLLKRDVIWLAGRSQARPR